MPSPFPGMDPYVEASLRTTFHHELSSEIVRQLTPLLRPKYMARTAERLVVEEPHVSVEIRSVENRTLVTAIEVLSPTNKRGTGRDEYLNKRRGVLLSSAHLVEIDLLPEGARVPMQKPLPAARYYVFVTRANRRPMTDIWPIQLADPLPKIPIPLLPGDVAVPLNLGAAFTSIYDGLGFDLGLDYTRPPETPLSSDEANWVDRILQESGHRS